MTKYWIKEWVNNEYIYWIDEWVNNEWIMNYWMGK